MKTAPIRCGECCFFKHECADGFGYCDITNYPCHFGDICNLNYKSMTNSQVVKILHYAQKWRRGAKMKMINPFVYGVAIDAAMLKLRRIKDEEV